VPIPLLVALAPAAAVAAEGEAHTRFGPVLFGLAVLVVVAKAGGLLAERWGQPSVLGELLAGIGLGNLLPLLAGGEEGIAFVQAEPTLRVLAELGILILLFDVGLEADLRALVRVGPSSTLVALIGVVAPFGLGWVAAAWLLPETPALVHVFVGASLTATSVGITARVLKDLGMTRSREGQTILGAAILDDVLGLVVLSVVSGAATAAAGTAALSPLAVGGILLRAALFLGLTVGLAHFVSGPIVRLAGATGRRGVLLILGLALCFSLAFVAELVGLADIIGAFAAGLLLDPYGRGVRTAEEAVTLSELLGPLSELFVPLFFVLIGIQVHLGSFFDLRVVGLAAVLTLCALAGKLACALGVVGSGVDRLAVAVGMVPRGEVGLIFAGIGASLIIGGEPLLSQGIFSALVLMVLITTLLTPLGLRWASRGRKAA
jgi:Kef-type K+ transport system membrane component KefB